MTHNSAEILLQRIWGERNNPFLILAKGSDSLLRDGSSTHVLSFYSRKWINGLNPFSYDFVDLMHDQGYGVPSNVEVSDEEVRIAA